MTISSSTLVTLRFPKWNFVNLIQKPCQNIFNFALTSLLSDWRFCPISITGDSMGAIHPTKISGPKLNGSVRSGKVVEVDHFSQSDRSEFWLNGSRPLARRLGPWLAHDKTKGFSRVFRGCFVAPLIWTLIVSIFQWLIETISRGNILYFK